MTARTFLFLPMIVGVGLLGCMGRGGFDPPFEPGFTAADNDNPGGDGYGGDTDPGPCTPGTQVLTITDTNDDGEIEINFNNEWFVNGEPGFEPYLRMGSCQSHDGPVWGYFRFALNVSLPAAAEVTDARLMLWGLENEGWDSANHALEIDMEDHPDPAPVVGRDDAPELAEGRPLVDTLRARWPASGGLAWDLGVWNTSPNLAQLLNEHRNRHGLLEAGDHVQFWVFGAGSLVDVFHGQVTAEDFGGTETHHAQLEITWVCP